MPDTRTITVEQLAEALRRGEPGQQPINMFADPFDDADADDVADAIWAALPTSTEGLDAGKYEAMRAFAHDVAMALTERKVPDEWDAANLTPPQMLEATAHLLDQLDDATDAYIRARKADIPSVSRSMQASLRDLAASLSPSPTEENRAMTTEKRDPGYPYGEFDARKWADEFDLIFPDKRPDTGTMLAWFANAIMTGYDKAKNEDQPPEPSR